MLKNQYIGFFTESNRYFDIKLEGKITKNSMKE